MGKRDSVNRRRRLVLSLVAVVALLMLAAPARAQGEAPVGPPTGIGIGAAAMLTGPSGLAISYNASRFHIDGILGFVDPSGGGGDSTLALGGRFLYHLHTSNAADFSIGGGVGLVNTFRDNQDDHTDLSLEGVVQIRAFVVDNVAFSASAGVAAVAADGDLFVVGGQLVGSVGIIYYFW